MGWRFLDKTCQIFAFSGPKNWLSLQELPNFDISQPKLPKSISLPTLKSIETANKYTPWLDLKSEKIPLRAANTQVPVLWESPPPRWFKIVETEITFQNR